MEDLQGAAVRVTRERERADEWAVVLAATGIPHRLRRRPDGWALIVAPLDAHAALDALDGYDREKQEERADTVAAVATPVAGATALGVAVALLLIGVFAVTGPRTRHSASWRADGAVGRRENRGWSSQRASPCSPSSARAQTPTSLPISSGSWSAACSVWPPDSRCRERRARRCNGCWRWPGSGRWSPLGSALPRDASTTSQDPRRPCSHSLVCEISPRRRFRGGPSTSSLPTLLRRRGQRCIFRRPPW